MSFAELKWHGIWTAFISPWVGVWVDFCMQNLNFSFFSNLQILRGVSFLLYCDGVWSDLQNTCMMFYISRAWYKLPTGNLHAVFCRESCKAELYMNRSIYAWKRISLLCHTNNFSVRVQNQQHEACETTCTSQKF